MNFRYGYLIALMGASSVMAMDDSTFDHTRSQFKTAAHLRRVEQSAAAQHLIVKKAQSRAQRVQEEKEKGPERVAIIGDAFAKLPNNKSRSEKEKQDFYTMIAARLPKEVQQYIGEFKGKNNTDFIEKHLMDLIPSVIRKHGFYPNMKILMSKATERLSEYATVHAERVKALVEENREQPYILAVAGFWAFNDESSQFRYRAGARIFCSNLTQWFQLHYPNNAVKPLGNDEWLAVLYSDGSIQWKISPLNKVRLKKLTKEQLILGVALWDQPDFLKENQLASYRLLPEYITSAMKSNYEIAASRIARYTHKWLRYAAMAGAVLVSGYWGYSWMDEAARPGYHYVIKLTKDGYYTRSERVGLSFGLDMLRHLGCLTAGLAGAIIPAYLYSIKETNKNGRDIFELIDIEGFGRKNKLPEVLGIAPLLGVSAWMFFGLRNAKGPSTLYERA